MKLPLWLELGGVDVVNGCQAICYAKLLDNVCVDDGCDSCCCPQFDAGCCSDPVADCAWWVDHTRPATYEFLGLWPDAVEWVGPATGSGAAQIQVTGVLMATTPQGLAAGRLAVQTHLSEWDGCDDRTGRIVTACDHECADCERPFTFTGARLVGIQEFDDGREGACAQPITITIQVSSARVCRTAGECVDRTVPLGDCCPLVECVEDEGGCVDDCKPGFQPQPVVDQTCWCEPWDMHVAAVKTCAPSRVGEFWPYARLGGGITGAENVRLLVFPHNPDFDDPTTCDGFLDYLQAGSAGEARIEQIPVGGAAVITAGCGQSRIECPDGTSTTTGVFGAFGGPYNWEPLADIGEVWLVAVYDACDAPKLGYPVEFGVTETQTLR